MNLKKVTPLILTFNEEANIGRTLRALGWAERIVVVDSFSGDGTVEILKADSRVQIIQRKFDSHATQWNYGLRETGIKTEWVLAMDADYILTDELISELGALAPTEGVSGYRVSFTYCINGRPLWGSLYPPGVVLYRPERGEYVQDGHTQRLRVEGTIHELKGRVLHDDRKPLSQWKQSQKRYARLEADKLAATSWSSLRWSERLRKLYLGPLLVLPYCLLVKGLILDGKPGLFYSWQRLYAEVLLAVLLAGVGGRKKSEFPRARE